MNFLKLNFSSISTRALLEALFRPGCAYPTRSRTTTLTRCARALTLVFITCVWEYEMDLLVSEFRELHNAVALAKDIGTTAGRSVGIYWLCDAFGWVIYEWQRQTCNLYCRGRISEVQLSPNTNFRLWRDAQVQGSRLLYYETEISRRGFETLIFQ